MRRTMLGVMLVTLGLVSAQAAAATRAARRELQAGAEGQYRTIQRAVDAAKPGDWILIGPGDYKTTTSRRPRRRLGRSSGRPRHHAAPAHPGHEPQHRRRRRHQARTTLQRGQGRPELRPGRRRRPGGAERVMVWKADNVSVRELDRVQLPRWLRSAGNGIWWNGGDESGQIGGWGFSGTYLTATSTYLRPEQHGERGRSTGSSRATGTAARGTTTYASNFNDSGLLHRRLPAAVQPDHEPRLGRVQRPRLLGFQLGRSAGGRELRVRQQRGRVRHQQPERRQPAAAERRLPGQGHQPHHPHATRAGCS